MKKVFSALDELFPISKMYLSYIPLYPAGMWSMACASRQKDPLSADVLSRAANHPELLSTLGYYNPEVHRGAFALPNFVKKIVE
jgi:spermidine synthase